MKNGSNRTDRTRPGTMYILLMAFGVLLLAGAASLLGHNTHQAHTAAASSAHILQALAQEPASLQTPQEAGAGAAEMETREIDGELYIGTISIPALSVELPVMESWSGERLRIAPCRYVGSYLEDNMIIAAHSYPAHFGGIGGLAPGDTVSFTTVGGTLHQYTVSDVLVIPMEEVQQMEDQSAPWDLTLFTCDYMGTGRITLRCVRENPSA